MNKLTLSLLIVLVTCALFSCKKSVEIENTYGVAYHVNCDSCMVSYKDVHQGDSLKKVYAHWGYSFSAVTGDSVCLRATNIEGGLLKLRVNYYEIQKYSDTTTQTKGFLSFLAKL